MISSLATCVLACLLASASSASITSAVLSFTPDTAFLTLNLGGTFNRSLLVTSSPLIIIMLREGFLHPVHLDTSAATVSGNTVSVVVPSLLFKTLPLPMFYSLTVVNTTNSSSSTSAISPVTDYPVTALNQGVVLAPPVAPKYCSPLKTQKSRSFTIESESDLANIAIQKCTHVAGPLIVRDMSLPASYYIAGLGLLRTIEGSLVIINNTNLLLDHFVGLESVASKYIQLALASDIVSAYVPYSVSSNISLVIVNNTGLQDSSDISSFLSMITDGFALFSNNSGSTCVDLGNAAIDPSTAYIEPVSYTHLTLPTIYSV